MRQYYKELIKEIKSKKLSREKISSLKNKLASKHKLRNPPTNIQVLLNADLKDIPTLKKYLLTKPTRTISGVAVVAVMTAPQKCPHGKCIMCPGGPSSAFGDVPQSYTGKEPATMRGIRNLYDSYLQVFNRLEQYVVLGHVPDKVELIIMGGTFPSFDKKYQEDFVAYAFKALNDFSKLFFKQNELDLVKFKEFFGLPGDIYDKKRAISLRKKILLIKTEKNKSKINLIKEQERNETAKIRCVGLTIETRPDYGKLEQGNEMLRLGATRVEVGVQSVYDDVLEKIKRGHTVQDSVNSIRVLKDLGFKINAHYMPGLIEDRKKDLNGMKQLFANQDFRPDMLKIYPCMVLKGTKLFDLYKKNKFKPISTEQAASLIAEFKQFIPEYCRVMRVQRDIPPKQAEAGVDRSNLRQYVDEFMRQNKIKCRCIRCREIGRAKKAGKPFIKVYLYNASKGKEFFISIEDKYGSLYGFCRLRFPSQFLRKEITKASALIRELHVYGPAIEIGKKGKFQHKGLGKKLLKKAEELAKQNKKTKVVVISGVGVREYYRKMGYKRQGPYMAKLLN